MIKIALIILITFSISTLVLADVNEKYIEKAISHMDKLLLKNQFVKGTVYFKNDSLETELLLFSKKGDSYSYLFCIAKLDNDSFKVYTAKEIDGYKIMDNLFVKHCDNEESFFIKKIKSGRIDLYEKKALPNDQRHLFYLKLPNIEHLIVINPLEKNISEVVLPINSSPAAQFSSKGIPQKFKEFIFTYLGDCETIRNLVDSEVYTIDNIRVIVETYNKCFKD